MHFIIDSTTHVRRSKATIKLKTFSMKSENNFSYEREATKSFVSMAIPSRVCLPNQIFTGIESIVTSVVP